MDSSHVWLMGCLIFFARICDVSLDTLRTIMIIEGMSFWAFITGFIEVIIWVFVISAVINHLNSSPILVFFYSLGFASGTAIGIYLEKKLCFGHVVIRIFSRNHGQKIAEKIRSSGQSVTIFQGEGLLGPVVELLVACRKKEAEKIIKIMTEEDPEGFYIFEHLREMRRNKIAFKALDSKNQLLK